MPAFRRVLFSLPLLFLPLVCTAEEASDECRGWLSDDFYRSATAGDVRGCLSAGRGLDERTGTGETPLHLAAAHGNGAELVRALLAEGADVALTTAENRTPLATAAAEGSSAAVISYLIVWGADPNARLSTDSCRLPLRTCAETSLHLAARRPDGAAIMAALVAGGAEVGSVNEQVQTPLHLAAKNAGLAEVRLLLQAGADVDATDEDGETPLHELTRLPNASPETVSAFLDAGASPDARAEEGVTPLLLATAYTESPEVFNSLLGASSEPCYEDERGRSVIMLYERNAALVKDARYWNLHERCAE
ncbi:Ankyrin repeat-containing protein [Tranquillimonas rosea]|uniref:Ankyrin repeat-containing protein n=1 Tax=Tranquillimonas rosea TaxID=641238 RepID=A0A1H9PH59_9RHOB|nr:ankyrin repeat domain-containing protein [Tranquillimonas rosea]SER47572.1 Ankyrin repeat-containing protein [Tranquillimonas rosea]